MPINDALLEAYIERFYGYGNFRGRQWLIGMEEGGGNSASEVQARLDVWQRRGEREIDDVRGFHRETGLDRWFLPNPPLQRTWAMLIRLLLSANGLHVTTEAVRAYQGEILGRADGPDCVLELLPLPSRSSRDWLYSQHSQISWLRDRTTYRDHVGPSRVQHLRDRIAEYRPPLVVFYGLVYRDWWERVTGLPFAATGLDGFHVARRNGTIFGLTRHPAHTGVTNQYFECAGAVINAMRRDVIVPTSG